MRGRFLEEVSAFSLLCPLLPPNFLHEGTIFGGSFSLLCPLLPPIFLHGGTIFGGSFSLLCPLLPPIFLHKGKIYGAVRHGSVWFGVAQYMVRRGS